MKIVNKRQLSFKRKSVIKWLHSFLEVFIKKCIKTRVSLSSNDGLLYNRQIQYIKIFSKKGKKMKKLLSLLLVVVMTFSFIACGQEGGGEEASTVTVTVTDSAGEEVDVEFPSSVERVVCLNYASLDFLDAVGLGDKVVGCLNDSGSTPKHLAKYTQSGKVTQVGTMKEPDMEAIMALEPDVIFSSDRTEGKYDQFSLIAPTFSAYIDYSAGYMSGFKILAEKHGKIMGVDTSKVNEIIAGYEERIAKIAEFAEGETCLLGIFTGGITTLGNSGRAMIVTNEMGFENLKADNVNYSNISSYESWLELDPDWMFVLDKDTVLTTEAIAAREQMEVNNPIIAETKAFKSGQIVYLEPGADWYVNDAGVTSLGKMITCIEEGIGLK